MGEVISFVCSLKYWDHLPIICYIRVTLNVVDEDK